MLASVNENAVLRALATPLLALLGGALLTWLGLPAGWLAGAMLFVAIASLAGLESEVPDKIRWIFFLYLGIFAGSGASPATLEQIALWPASFAMLLVTVAGIICTSYILLRRLFRWDGQTAFFASLPGALSFVLATAEKVDLDIRKVAVAQSIRLLILVEIFPLVVLLFGWSSVQTQAAPQHLMNVSDMVLLLGCGTIGGLIAERAGLPGGLLLGGLAVSAGLFVSGTVTGKFPDWLVICGMIGLGAIIGSRFRPSDRPILPQIALASITAFSAVMALAALMALLTSHLLGIDFLQIFLAFAPGGLDAVTILAFAMQIDPAFVAAHHVVRFFMLALCVPIVGRWVFIGEKRSDG